MIGIGTRPGLRAMPCVGCSLGKFRVILSLTRSRIIFYQYLSNNSGISDYQIRGRQ